MADERIRGFIEVLASAAPTPGGGGASALVGAVGMALGNMVGSLTLGKKKYADVQADMDILNGKAAVLQEELLALIDQDAEGFAPLAAAYGLPKNTEEERTRRERIMEEALKGACAVPLIIMEKVCAAIDLLEEYGKKGTAIAISDVGVGAACCRAALLGASLNVFINTGSMKDRSEAEKIDQRAEDMLAVYTAKADAIFAAVRNRF